MLKVCECVIPIMPYSPVKLPQGAKILGVQEKYGKRLILALADPENQPETRNFRLAKTGDPIKEAEELLNYIGTLTLKLEKGNCLGHLFEIREEQPSS